MGLVKADTGTLDYSSFEHSLYNTLSRIPAATSFSMSFSDDSPFIAPRECFAAIQRVAL